MSAKELNLISPECKDLAPMESKPGSLLDIISQAATNPAVDVDKLERLIALSDRQQAKEAERLFNVAMTGAQKEMRPVAADASNPQTKSKYASYFALDKALRPIYVAHGFSLSFDTDDSPKADHIRILCYVSHEAGHSRTYKIDMPSDGKGAKGGDVMTKTHAAGAAVSYGQRYLLKSIFNISVGEDNDGNDPYSSVTLTDDQIQTVRELIEKVNADLEKFCAYFKIGSLSELRQVDYPRAIQSLNLKAKGTRK